MFSTTEAELKSGTDRGGSWGSQAKPLCKHCNKPIRKIWGKWVHDNNRQSKACK